MKKFLFCFSLVFFGFAKSAAQLFEDEDLTMNIFGIVPPKYCGWGGGVGFTSPTIKLLDIDKDRELGLRLGYDFWGTRLYHREIKGVPLEAPQKGNASVFMTESAGGFNFYSRFTVPINDIFQPYIDVFGGYRWFRTNLEISPDSIQPGYERFTLKNLTNIQQPDYGGSIGIQVQLGDLAKLDAAVMCTRSDRKNAIYDVSSAKLDGNDVVLDKIAAPKDVVVVKLGFMFSMCGSGSGGGGGHHQSGGRGHGGGGGRSSSVHVRSGGKT